ncbi:hypothetical protein BH737_04260 [Enterococcus hirae]|nr:hypothetical protein BH737_04260 [Enterococcus hirae]
MNAISPPLIFFLLQNYRNAQILLFLFCIVVQQIKKEVRQKCFASRNKKGFPKIDKKHKHSFFAVDCYLLGASDATFVSLFIRFLEILKETKESFSSVSLF